MRVLDTPFFSIVVPVHNVGQYLTVCLDSMLAQSFRDWECLCTDDGSQDSSDLILDSYARRDSRFRIVHQPNAGVSGARNRSLDRVCGQWVGFLDGDDWLARDWCVHVFGLINTFSGIDFIRFGIKQKKGLRRLTGSAAAEFALVMLRDAVWLFVCKTEIIRRVRFQRGLRVGEDWLFGLQAGLKASQVLICDYNGYGYRARSGSATRQNRKPQDALIFLPEYAKYILQEKEKLEETGLFHTACKQFTISVRLMYTAWFGTTVGIEDFYAKEYRSLLHQLRPNKLFLLKHLEKEWLVPFAVFYCGGSYKIIRWWWKLIRGIIICRDYIKKKLTTHGVEKE